MIENEDVYEVYYVDHDQKDTHGIQMMSLFQIYMGLLSNTPTWICKKT